MRLVVLALGLAFVLALVPRLAAAAPDDGLYRRFDRDFVLDVGVGVGARSGASAELAFTSAGALRLRYLDAAGLVLEVGGGPELGASLRVGAELRPLFPALFLTDRWAGRPWPELLVQSLFFELLVEGGPFEEPGFAFVAGVGFDVPLTPPRQHGAVWRGAFLRLLARRTVADARFQGGPERTRSGFTLMAQLALRLGVGRGLSAWEPPRSR
ncbi:MAG: hypothetical protein AAF447_14485 [Myxococcota bacterium]